MEWDKRIRRSSYELSFLCEILSCRCFPNGFTEFKLERKSSNGKDEA
jgi:hypothetical protein